MYYNIMTSRITKLVLVPLEEWKRLNKNGVGGVGGGGDTYTTIEIPSSKPRNQEGRRKNQEEKELNPSPPPLISHRHASQDDEELGGLPLPPLIPSSKKGRRERGGEGRGELKLSEMLVMDLLEKEFQCKKQIICILQILLDVNGYIYKKKK